MMLAAQAGFNVELVFAGVTALVEWVGVARGRHRLIHREIRNFGTIAFYTSAIQRGLERE